MRFVLTIHNDLHQKPGQDSVEIAPPGDADWDVHSWRFFDGRRIAVLWTQAPAPGTEQRRQLPPR